MKAGIDEAGRGPVFGPMVMAIVAGSVEDEKYLKELGVKDSKLLSKKKRDELYSIIKKKFANVIIAVDPVVIDDHVLSESSSLNILESKISSKLINALYNKTKINEVMMDLPSKNKIKYLNDVKEDLLMNDVLCNAEFKADINYVLVSAASILAKVTRDEVIASFKEKNNIDIGSGYPSDPKTKMSLKNNTKKLLEYGIIRKSWKTYMNVIANQ